MFDPSSRYFNLKDKKYKIKKQNNMGSNRANEEITITYKERRFIPIVKEMNILKEITTVAGDRLDNISSQIIGDPEQFWQICDTNEVMHPLELTDEPGKIIRIGLIQQTQ